YTSLFRSVRALERVEAGLLDLAELRRKHDRPLRVELSHRDHVEDTLPGLESRKEVHDRFPLRVPAADRDAVGLEPVALALAREEQNVVVARRGEEVDDEVLLLRLHAGDALAPAPLRAVAGRRYALDVARVRARAHDVLLGTP